MNADDHDMEITLPMLKTIEGQSDITQRNLAKRLGLALGLTNSYLKHCVSKGLVKIEQIPANRYLYYLTPKGFSEKSRLTAHYLSKQFTFYRSASDSCARVFNACVEKGWDQVVLCGASELAEIAVLQAGQNGVTIRGLFDPRFKGKDFLGHPAWKAIDELPDEAICMITTFNKAQYLRRQLLAITEAAHIIAPDILEL